LSVVETKIPLLNPNRELDPHGQVRTLEVAYSYLLSMQNDLLYRDRLTILIEAHLTPLGSAEDHNLPCSIAKYPSQTLHFDTEYTWSIANVSELEDIAKSPDIVIRDENDENGAKNKFNLYFYPRKILNVLTGSACITLGCARCCRAVMSYMYRISALNSRGEKCLTQGEL